MPPCPERRAILPNALRAWPSDRHDSVGGAVVRRVALHHRTVAALCADQQTERRPLMPARQLHAGRNSGPNSARPPGRPAPNASPAPPPWLRHHWTGRGRSCHSNRCPATLVLCRISDLNRSAARRCAAVAHARLDQVGTGHADVAHGLSRRAVVRRVALHHGGHPPAAGMRGDQKTVVVTVNVIEEAALRWL